ncbi:MAG: cupin domain-containing protein [Oscillospiraceae bacterium]|jgi:transcriptional regulator with XRE-family HTH domain|nr:cupin domain-containing protein [Oscillospiraceae bacterium]
MEPKIAEIARRIRTLREDLNISLPEMAAVAGVSEPDYAALESGERDFSFTFLRHCANRLGVDIIELLTGENPHLTSYSVTRAGTGLPIKRRAGFSYEHLAATFKTKKVEPFVVRAPYSSADADQPVALSAHEGQELDYILSGSLKVVIDGHTETLNAGDSVIYDSGKPHGMIATGGGECVFLAFVF